MTTGVLWFRRDLRLGDHPALLAAAEAGPVVPLFVLDEVVRGPAGPPRLAFLYGCLRDLDAATGGRLVVRSGRPEDVVPDVAAEVAASAVHVSADYGPYGRRRDEAVEAALAARGSGLRRVGSPYAVAPGRVTKADGTPFAVYSPFYRAWLRHGWRQPAGDGRSVRWATGVEGEGVPPYPELGSTLLPPAGESAAGARFSDFIDEHVGTYATGRNRPALPATSRLSAYLKYGCIHPRSLLAALGEGGGEERFRSELAWREFYADVLFHRPESVRVPLQPAMARMDVDDGPDADARFEVWARGHTGYPIVDAGMRQLAAEAYVHNRVRMIVASFLVKDLHLDWRRGAAYFMSHLVDGDLASNSQGWQWVAGTGTDPAPYFRVFNPTLQGQKFDPDGDYVRHYVPELRGVSGGAVHEPWSLPGGLPEGYPAPVVDHRAERAEALTRYQRARS